MAQALAGDDLVLETVCAIPFEERLAFGLVFDRFLERVTVKEKGFPEEKLTKPRGTFPPSRNRNGSYRGKGKTGRWSYLKRDKSKDFILNPNILAKGE